MQERVGGGILAIVSDQCAVAAWSPGQDQNGNSVAAAAALEEFVRVTGETVY